MFKRTFDLLDQLITGLLDVLKRLVERASPPMAGLALLVLIGVFSVVFIEFAEAVTSTLPRAAQEMIRWFGQWIFSLAMAC